jgi:hypothetical protein
MYWPLAASLVAEPTRDAGKDKKTKNKKQKTKNKKQKTKNKKKRGAKASTFF